MTDGPTDGRTDGRTDRRTDGQRLFYSCASATKKENCCRQLQFSILSILQLSIQWYDGMSRDPPSLAQSCRQIVRQRILEKAAGGSISERSEAKTVYLTENLFYK